jgi:hypothetical protein
MSSAADIEPRTVAVFASPLGLRITASLLFITALEHFIYSINLVLFRRGLTLTRDRSQL